MHDTLGRVRVTLRRNSRRVSARWKDGAVSLNAPAGIRSAELGRILDDLAPRLMARRPAVSYYDGQRIVTPYVEFQIKTQRFAPENVIGTPGLPVCAVEVGTARDFSSEACTLAVSDMLCKLARHIAPKVLIPRARELAARVGRRPVGWSISSGHRTLGRCSSQGLIALSYVLVFLPQELSDYVILHELAHLSEMNHSDRFHALLDSYLGGRERELVGRLHDFRWPVYRK